MIEFLIVVLLVIGGLIFIVVKRGAEMTEIAAHGVDVKGVVVEKRSVPGARNSSRQQKLVYAYTDAQGATHQHTSVVTYDTYDRYQVGDQIDIVYSSKRPQVSAMKEMVEFARKK